METTWQDPELRFLLGEMIKASSVDVQLLADFIRAHHIEQNWMNMQLPIGRTMQQCMGAAERVLSIQQQPPSYFHLKRKPSLESGEQQSKRQATMPPIELAHPPRTIQPRPTATSYTPAPVNVVSTPNVPSAVATGTGKKRGRPSKADKEAQARANSFRTLEYAPITPAPAPAASASTNVASQREYVSSPGYDFNGNTLDVKGRKRATLGGNEHSPSTGYHPMASPASVPDTRGPMESAEQSNQSHSPRDRGGGGQLTDTRAAYIHPQMQHPSASPGQSQTTPIPHSHTLPPIQSGPRPPDQYRQEPPRMIDPIFPDRDRSRSAFDPISRATPPAPPVANRG